MFDRNRDKRIELGEFAEIIFTDEQWTPFDLRDKLSKRDFDEIFNYYDKDGSEYLECGEMRDFLKDITVKIGQVPTKRQLEEQTAVFFRLYDTDKNGKLSRDELRFLLTNKK
ncbi:DgyrCDS34 [Dimorphilus gyrociliatus]|uniref:DgyrCDS34 n=1 Tax=Dimorphilus gyrociliatus TaxID=2664684 RepID=A0A7I8V557_9ANNE|nr:DgyrCDS34 [Dimorphilus gyrociliatus]